MRKVIMTEKNQRKQTQVYEEKKRITNKLEFQYDKDKLNFF